MNRFMSKSRFTKAGFVVLLLLLIISASLNIFFYQKGRGYYLELNSTRLDPFSLSYYPNTANQPATSANTPLIVFFGDSRAADWTAPTMDGVAFINRGIGAQTTAQALGRFPDHVLPLQPNIVIIQIGINDLKTIPLFPLKQSFIVANCEANIQKMVDLSLQNGSQVILTTIFPSGQLSLERRLFWSDEVGIAIAEVNRFIASLASEQVKIFDTVLFLANDHGIVDPLYSKDFWHLNAKGYDVLNQELVELLRP